MKVLLNEKEVEEIYGLNRRTLQRWRVSGVGPCFIRANRSIKYSIKDIEDFLSDRKHSSTSEYGMQARKCSRETAGVELAREEGKLGSKCKRGSRIKQRL